MPDEVKTFSGSLVLDLRIWWHHVHTLYAKICVKENENTTLKHAHCQGGKLKQTTKVDTNRK